MLYKISFWGHILGVLLVVGLIIWGWGLIAIPFVFYFGYFIYAARDHAHKGSAPTKAKIAHLISLISNGLFAGFFVTVLTLMLIGEMLDYAPKESFLGGHYLGTVLVGGGGVAVMIVIPAALLALVLLVIARVKDEPKGDNTNGENRTQNPKQGM